MIKVTVLYNLPPGTDEAEFLRWRTTSHHAANIARPGVVRTDFYKIVGTPVVGPERPASDTAPYRFVTESYYESFDSFRASWEDPAEQARLVPAVAKIADALFLLSEEVQTHVKPTE
jgi:EthD domain